MALFLVKPVQHIVIKLKYKKKTENLPFTGFNMVCPLLSLLCLHKIIQMPWLPSCLTNK